VLPTDSSSTSAKKGAPLLLKRAIRLAIASQQAVRYAETAEPFPKGLPVKETRLRGFLIRR
jgi:hypothetical protein